MLITIIYNKLVEENTNIKRKLEKVVDDEDDDDDCCGSKRDLSRKL